MECQSSRRGRGPRVDGEPCGRRRRPSLCAPCRTGARTRGPYVCCTDVRSCCGRVVRGGYTGQRGVDTTSGFQKVRSESHEDLWRDGDSRRGHAELLGQRVLPAAQPHLLTRVLRQILGGLEGGRHRVCVLRALSNELVAGKSDPKKHWERSSLESRVASQTTSHS